METHLDALAVELRQALASEPVRLDRVALAIARLDDAPVRDADVLATLDRWAARVRAEVDAGAGGASALAAVLGGELGLRGDDERYDEPENSFLPRVLARRRGLPIVLSLVYLEVARRARVPLIGLALPGHFVVAEPAGDGALIVLDPFAGGRVVGAREVEALVARAGARLRPDLLTAATGHTIATRMLRNLIGSYQRRGRRHELGAVATLLRALDADDAGARRVLADLAAATDDRLN